MVIDDCWHASSRDPKTGAPVADPEKFPNGIKALADEIHSLGLKVRSFFYFTRSTLTKTVYLGLESMGYEPRIFQRMYSLMNACCRLESIAMLARKYYSNKLSSHLYISRPDSKRLPMSSIVLPVAAVMGHGVMRRLMQRHTPPGTLTISVSCISIPLLSNRPSEKHPVV